MKRNIITICVAILVFSIFVGQDFVVAQVSTCSECDDRFVNEKGDTIRKLKVKRDLTVKRDLFVDGNVGIGTTGFAVPNKVLQISDSATPYIIVEDTTTPTQLAFAADDSTGFVGTLTNSNLRLRTGWVDRVTIDTSGNVGIGTTSPNHPLEMGSGAHVTAGGVWTNASSRDYKENIRNLTIEEAKEALDKLRPTRFNYKVDKEDEYLGFIAEDVPELVANKDRKGLSPMDIVAVLTKVVQRQQKDIEERE